MARFEEMPGTFSGHLQRVETEPRASPQIGEEPFSLGAARRGGGRLAAL